MPSHWWKSKYVVTDFSLVLWFNYAQKSVRNLIWNLDNLLNKMQNGNNAVHTWTKSIYIFGTSLSYNNCRRNGSNMLIGSQKTYDTKIINILMMNGTFFKPCVKETTTLNGF